MPSITSIKKVINGHLWVILSIAFAAGGVAWQVRANATELRRLAAQVAQIHHSMNRLLGIALSADEEERKAILTELKAQLKKEVPQEGGN